MSRLREFHRSTVSVEKTVFDDMLVRLEKLENLEKAYKNLEVEIQKEKEKEKINFCTEYDFVEWITANGYDSSEQKWLVYGRFIEYTVMNPISFLALKKSWFEQWRKQELEMETYWKEQARKEELEKELRKSEEVVPENSVEGEKSVEEVVEKSEGGEKSEELRKSEQGEEAEKSEDQIDGGTLPLES